MHSEYMKIKPLIAIAVFVFAGSASQGADFKNDTFANGKSFFYKWKKVFYQVSINRDTPGDTVKGVWKETDIIFPRDNDYDYFEIDKNSQPKVIPFTGKILSQGAQSDKLEIRFQGEVPYDAFPSKGKIVWKIVHSKQNSGKLNVPMVTYNGGEEFHDGWDFDEETHSGKVAPTEKTTTPQPVAESKNSTLLVGTWLPTEGEVAQIFKSDHTYSFETEGAAFEEGNWLLEGDKLITTDTEGNKSANSVKFISNDTFDYISKKGRPSRWNRYQN